MLALITIGLGGHGRPGRRLTYLIFVVQALFSIEVKGIFGGKASVLRIKFAEADVRGPHVGHAASLGLLLACQERLNDASQQEKTKARSQEGKEGDGPRAEPATVSMAARPGRLILFSMPHPGS